MVIIYLLFIEEVRKKYKYEDFGKSLIKMNKRFPLFNKYERKDIEDATYQINHFFKDNIYIILNDINNKLYLNKNDSITDMFEIKYQNNGTYTIKNIVFDVYLGDSNIQIRDEFNILLKEYIL